MNIEKRVYQNVSASSTVTSDYIIPNGSFVEIQEMGGSGETTSNISFEIIWDPSGANQLLLSANVATSQRSESRFTGNGSKVLRIKLINNNVTSKNIGAYYLGTEREV